MPCCTSTRDTGKTPHRLSEDGKRKRLRTPSWQYQGKEECEQLMGIYLQPGQGDRVWQTEGVGERKTKWFSMEQEKGVPQSKGGGTMGKGEGVGKKGSDEI